MGIHMLDAAMYVLGFPAVKSMMRHSFRKIGTQKSCGQFLVSGIRQLTASKIRCLAPLNFITAAFCGWKRHLHSTSGEQSIMNVSFCGDKAGATLFQHISTR
ncbi:hypothetical protein ACLB1N_07645 [Escherichia coli]